jgi:hypothetical protein
LREWRDGTKLFVLPNEFNFEKRRRANFEKVKYWSEELSNNCYDGIIGLSQGAAMAALLVCMVTYYAFRYLKLADEKQLNDPSTVAQFNPGKEQNIKFGIFCSGV